MYLDNTTTESPYTNFTISPEEEKRTEIFKVLVSVIMGVLMFGMGCAVEYDKLFQSFKRPTGLCVGMACQIFMMPVLAFILMKIAKLNKLQSLAFMLVGCSPGGSTSNFITFLLDGDMCLSVAITTMTNMLAFATVPAWLALFSHVENIDHDLRIPYDALGTSLAALIIPIVSGVAFRYKFPKKAAKLPKFCAVFGFIFLIIIIIAMVLFNSIPVQFRVETIMPEATLPVAGMTFSFLISSIPLLKLEKEARKTIAVEISIQNGGFSTAVIFLSFAHRMALFIEVITIPILYSVTQMVTNIIVVCAYRLYLCRKNSTCCFRTLNAEAESVRTESTSSEDHIISDSLTMKLIK